MDFNPGDQVVHPNFGVGAVRSIEPMSFPGSQPRPYYRVEFSRTTLWVPVGDPTARGLRPVTPKNQLYRFRTLLKNPPKPLNQDFRSRQNELENQIKAGTFRSLCEIVRDLSAWNELKSLNHYETGLLKQARGALAAEWAAASGLAVNDALKEIDGYLSKGRLHLAAG